MSFIVKYHEADRQPAASLSIRICWDSVTLIMRSQEVGRALSEAEKNGTAHQLTEPLFRLDIDKAHLAPGAASSPPSASYDDVYGQEEPVPAVHGLIKRPIRHGRLFFNSIDAESLPPRHWAVPHTPEAHLPQAPNRHRIGMLCKSHPRGRVF